MISDDNDPADLADFRARREERRLEQWYKHVGRTPDYERQIPPRINPDTDNMIRQIEGCYVDTENELTWLEDKFGELVHIGKLDPEAGHGLQETCRQLNDVLYDNTAGAIRAWDGGNPHFIADRVKYCFATLVYQLAQMQYHLAELAGTGRLDRHANHDLQWAWFEPALSTIYHGTVMAVVDLKYWDGMWDWHGGTYEDGRVVITKIDLGGPEDALFPYNELLCGDGPIAEHPLSTVCHIEPVEQKDKSYHHLMVDLSHTLTAYVANITAISDAELLDLSIEAAQESLLLEPLNWEDPDDAAMLELSNELANESAAKESPWLNTTEKEHR